MAGWQKEKRASEDEMAGWHHRCNEHKFWQTPGDGEQQECLACCRQWGRKELRHNWVMEQQIGEIFPI